MRVLCLEAMVQTSKKVHTLERQLQWKGHPRGVPGNCGRHSKASSHTSVQCSPPEYAG